MTIAPEPGGRATNGSKGIPGEERDSRTDNAGVAGENTRAVRRRKRLRRDSEGARYGEGVDGPLACRHVRDVVTESGAQGLEFDAMLLAWRPNGTLRKLYASAWKRWTPAEPVDKKKGAVSEKA